MPAEVDRVERDDDQMAESPRDLLLAPRAEIRLGGLEGLDPADLDVG